MNVTLSNTDLRLLVQSLTHCLASCDKKSKEQPCDDCRAAQELKKRLEHLLEGKESKK